jgi:hypothetical protein
LQKTELPLYIRIVEALETPEDLEASSCCPTVDEVKEENERMEAVREPLFGAETEVATELVRVSKPAEVPGAYNLEKPDIIPKPIILPEPQLSSDYITAPCKHECNVIKQIRHAKHAYRVISALNPTKQTLLRATVGQCGLDCSLPLGH